MSASLSPLRTLSRSLFAPRGSLASLVRLAPAARFASPRRAFSASSTSLARSSRQQEDMPLPINLGVNFVPQQEAWIVERMGKYSEILQPGLNFLIPGLDRIAYRLSLKETAIEIESQTAITSDNVTVAIDGVLFLRIIDPYKAAYGVNNAQFAVSQLAQTTMRSEIGVLTLDKTFSERASLNILITEAINSASRAWGVECLRYEIKDIEAPATVIQSMQKQVSAEREKRAEILRAEGQKQSLILASEGESTSKINLASASARSAILAAEAQARSLQLIGDSIRREGGGEASGLRVAEKWVEQWGKVAKASTVVVVPSGLGDVAGFVGSAMSIYKNIASTAPTSSSTDSSPTQRGRRLEDSASSSSLQDRRDPYALTPQPTVLGAQDQQEGESAEEYADRMFLR